MADTQQEYVFLELKPAVKGKATAADHAGQIVLEDLQFSITQSGKWQEESSDSGRVTSFTDISFTKDCDKSSPTLYQACAMKTKFDEATISIKSGKDVVLKVILEKCILTGTSMSYAAGQDNPLENYSMSFKKMKWEKWTEKTGFDLEKDDKA